MIVNDDARTRAVNVCTPGYHSVNTHVNIGLIACTPLTKKPDPFWAKQGKNKKGGRGRY